MNKHVLLLIILGITIFFLTPLRVQAIECYPNPRIDPSHEQNYIQCLMNSFSRMFCPTGTNDSNNDYCCIKPSFETNPSCPDSPIVTDPDKVGQWQYPCGPNLECDSGLVCISISTFKDGRICCVKDDISCLTPPKTDIPVSIPAIRICEGVGEAKVKACRDCMDNGENGEEGAKVWTAIGCINTNPEGFITDFLKIALGIAGGIALLLMIYGSFLISTSAGDPKKAEEGKEMITGTIAGLLFIIFSVFLLKLIGVDILQIPGF